VGLRRFDHLHWMTPNEDLWAISDYLTGIPHTRLLTGAMGRRLNRVDARLTAAGQLGGVE
jgi:hypothetical protein